MGTFYLSGRDNDADHLQSIINQNNSGLPSGKKAGKKEKEERKILNGWSHKKGYW
jgi:hypothetical protein